MKFTPEMYEAYQRIKPMMMQLYPNVLDDKEPKPINTATIARIKEDPYLRFSDEELAAFFNVWIARREYTLSICKLQTYYGDTGAEVGPIPVEEICDRARHLAKFSEKLNMSNRAWKRAKGKSIIAAAAKDERHPYWDERERARASGTTA